MRHGVTPFALWARRTSLKLLYSNVTENSSDATDTADTVPQTVKTQTANTGGGGGGSRLPKGLLDFRLLKLT